MVNRCYARKPNTPRRSLFVLTVHLGETMNTQDSGTTEQRDGETTGRRDNEPPAPHCGYLFWYPHPALPSSKPPPHLCGSLLALWVSFLIPTFCKYSFKYPKNRLKTRSDCDSYYHKRSNFKNFCTITFIFDLESVTLFSQINSNRFIKFIYMPQCSV